MAVKGHRVTVANTATPLYSVPADLIAGQSILLKIKTGAARSCDIGAADVATGAGYELEVGESVNMDLQAGETVYGITASSTVEVHVLEIGV